MDQLKAFTIRIPRYLANSIDAQAQLNHRKRNGEIISLLQRAMELQNVEAEAEARYPKVDPTKN